MLFSHIFATCISDSTQFGIVVGEFDYANRIEYALALRSFEEPGVWRIRLFRLDSFPPGRVIDIVQDLKSTHFCVYDSIFFFKNSKKINKNKLITKKFELIGNEMIFFQDSVKKLNVETMSNLNTEPRTDGNRFYLIKIILYRYNIFTYFWSEDCSETRQHRFISYISRLVKEKTSINF